MQAPCCLSCTYPNPTDARPTAAFVTLFSHAEPEAILRKLSTRARSLLIPGLTAYCTRCRCSTILSTQATLQDALIEHELLHRSWAFEWSRQHPQA